MKKRTKKKTARKKKPASARKKNVVSAEQALLSGRLAAFNDYKTEYNKLMAPLKRSWREHRLLGTMNREFLATFRKKRTGVQAKLEGAQSRIQKKHKIPQLIEDLRRYYPVPCHGGVIKPLDGDVSGPSLLDRGQPGVLVQGGLHPCCAWYTREQTLDWSEQEGPDLEPLDPALTGFHGNWLSDNRLQVGYGIKGLLDDEYSTKYESEALVRSQYYTERKGRIRKIDVSIDFVNAYLYAGGTQDWDWFGLQDDQNDCGFAGVYYKAVVHRTHEGVRFPVWATFNTNLFDPYFFSPYLEHMRISEDTNINAAGWPGGSHAAWFHYIPDLGFRITVPDGDSRLNMAAGDGFDIEVGLKFYAYTLGDEYAKAGVNVYNCYGHTGYAQFNPLSVVLEECPD